MKLLISNPGMKLAMLSAFVEVNSRGTLPNIKIPDNVPALFPEAELEHLVAENKEWIETIRTPIVRAVVAKSYITQWFNKNCVYDTADPEAIRPDRCNKKHERVFNEWDALERAYLQPCGFFDPQIEDGGPPRKVDRMRARRSIGKKGGLRFGVPHELENDQKRQFLKDLKLQHYEQLTMQLDRESQLAATLEERTSEDYWDYFDAHQDEFEDVRINRKQQKLDTKLKNMKPVQLKKSGMESEHTPRRAIEFLMNQMRLYAKRYVSMCPAQLRSKDHTTRIRRIRRGLDELAADMEVIHIQKFQRNLLKDEKVDESMEERLRKPGPLRNQSGAPDNKNESDQLEKDPNQPMNGARGRTRPPKTPTQKDDSGNLLLDLLLNSNLKKDSKLREDH